MKPFLKASALALIFSSHVYAAEVPPPAVDWHRCASDADCILVDGICGKAAVNWAYKDDATKYYAQEAKKAKCQAQFWRAEPAGARCRLESCELRLESQK